MKRNIISNKIGLKLLFVVLICFFISLLASLLISRYIINYYIINTKNVSVAVYNTFALFIFLIGIITFIFSFYLFINKKVRYLKYITERVKQIANEDLGSTIEIQGSDEIAELCASINSMSKELKNKFEHERQMENAKNELITSISHDLRTPLTSIIGYVDLLRKKDYNDEDQYNEYLETIYNKSLNLKKLINELFEYTRLQSPDIKLNRNVADLGGLLQQLIGEYIPIFERDGLKLLKDIPEHDIAVNIDVEKIARVFENILINAKNYSNRVSDINIKVKKNNGIVAVSISNSVDKMPVENLNKLFERFYRVDKARNSESGTGLGLAIAKRITELHDGRIWAEYSSNIITFNVELKTID